MGKEAYKQKYTTLGVGQSAPYATIGHSVSVSGLWGDLSSNYGDVVEGGVIIDKSIVDSATLVNMVVNGPMLNEDLPAGTVYRLFDGNKPATANDKFGSFDAISLDLYMAIWRKVGAKIGHRNGGDVVWESGEVEPIPPAEKRYSWQT